jgi:hypothetical protein
MQIAKTLMLSVVAGFVGAALAIHIFAFQGVFASDKKEEKPVEKIFAKHINFHNISG